MESRVISTAEQIYLDLVNGKYEIYISTKMPVYGEVLIDYELIPKEEGVEKAYLTSITCGRILWDDYVFQLPRMDLTTTYLNGKKWSRKAKKFILRNEQLVKNERYIPSIFGDINY